MSHLFWLDQERLNRIKRILPKPRGVDRYDDRKVLSGITHVIRNGLRWSVARPCQSRRGEWQGRVAGQSGRDNPLISQPLFGACHPCHLKQAFSYRVSP